MQLHRLEVGQPYIPGRTSFPEAVQYNYRAGQHELLMWLRSPTDKEILDTRQGEAAFALYTEGPLLLFLYRFGEAIRWSDAPYSWHLVPDEERALPHPAEMAEPHALLTVILVDAATGIVQGIRAVTFPPAFTAALHLAIRRQAAGPWDPAAYDRALDALYRRYPASASLLEVAQSRAVGGAS